MAKLCLKCRYERKFTDTTPDHECPQCGAVYAKVEAVRQAEREATTVAREASQGNIETGVATVGVVRRADWEAAFLTREMSQGNAEGGFVTDKGRLGRLRYMAYQMGLFFVAGILLVTGMPVAMLLWAVVSGIFRLAGRFFGLSGGITFGHFLGAIAVIIVIGYLFVNVRWTIRRLHDLNVNGGFILILILPLIGLLLWLVPRVDANLLGWSVSALSAFILILPLISLPLWLIPGTRGENSYGPMQPRSKPGIVLVALGMPLAFVGLAAFSIFAYRDYQIRLQLNEAYTLSNPARTALGIACMDGDLASKMDNALLGLASPTDYRTKAVKSIEAAGLNSASGKMTITFRAIGDAIPEGAQTVFHGECSSRGMTWTVTTRAGMPSKFAYRP